MKNLAAHIEQQFREKALELRACANNQVENYGPKRARFLKYARQFDYLADVSRASLDRRGRENKARSSSATTRVDCS
jgi:hypothetical protein